MPTQISSLDRGYITGDLSLFPNAIDDKESLYEAKNNAETTLKSGLSYNAKYVVVNSTKGFANSGLLRVGLGPGVPGDPELIFYSSKTDYLFKGLIRGWASSKQNTWPTGSPVTSSVMAEHHNAVKDAIINMELKIGDQSSSDTSTLVGAVRDLEAKYLSPKAEFRVYPAEGPAPLLVRFQSFCYGDVIRYLWDFGDGGRSTDKNPHYIYAREGIYSVKLNIITSTGGQGITTKLNLIVVDDTKVQPFFYVVQQNPETPAYSIETADEIGGTPAVFSFVDQTDGDIIMRSWTFGDGQTETIEDPNAHSTTHTYELQGVYEPMLLIVYSDTTTKRAFLRDNLVVL